MKHAKLLAFLMAAAFLARLPLCLEPPEALLSKAVSDDMFYYLCMARNAAGGRGATVDGENPTNGFHPLWLLVLIPMYVATGCGAAFIHGALAALTLFSVLSAWFLYALLRRACGEWPSLLSALVWLCCPYAVIVGLSGVEAPLYVLLLGAVSCGHLRGRETGCGARFVLGLLAGVCVLARLDGAVIAAVIAAEMLASPWARGIPARKRFPRAASFAAGCALPVLPWLAWSYARTGSLFQMSGSAIYHQQHVLFRVRTAGAPWGSFALSWLSNVAANARGSFSTIALLSGLSPVAGIAAVAVCAALVAAAAVKDPALFRDWLRRCAGLAFLFFYGLMTFLLYCAYLWYSQDWYFYSVVFTACAALGCVLDLADGTFSGALPRAARTAARGAIALCLAAFFTMRTVSWWERGTRGWQLDMYRAARWAAENLPRRARIGSFNSGIAAWYCPQTVINLDGVANGAAHRAVLAGRVFDYVRDERIGWLIESPISIRFRALQSPAAPPPPLRAVHVEASYPEARARGNPVVVYEVEGGGGGR